MSIVRDNLMEQEGYSPYCGNNDCFLRWPRTTFNGKQFECKCGWKSQFPTDFICEYKHKWHKPSENCQNGRADICLAGSRDGICCAEHECDIDYGVRPK